MKTHEGKKGFTLVEVMIAAVSAAILALIVALILFMSYREWRIDNEYAGLRRDAALAVQIMAKEIRNSTLSGITVVANSSLQCQTNAAHPAYTTLFTRNAANGSLNYYKNGNLQETLVTQGLQVFNPQKLTNGVLLQLSLVDTDGDISITNRTFISARN